MTLQTPRFGQVEYEEARIILIDKGLPGFEQLKRYIIIDVQETKPVAWLQCIDDPDVALPVIHTFEILEDYAFDVQDEEIAALDIQGAGDLLVLNVVVMPQDLTTMTANLVAPILVNLRTGLGRQVLIDQPAYSTKTPIFEIICATLQKEGDAHVGAHA